MYREIDGKRERGVGKRETIKKESNKETHRSIDNK
jgi:hypothetical protein